jgi:hypothetical protein
VIGLILFGQNHLYVKMLFYKGFRYSEVFQKILQSEKSVPCQPFGRRVIPSGRSSVHCSIRPDDVLYRPDTTSGHQDRTSIIRLDDVAFRPDSPLYREASIPASIRPNVSAARLDASQYLTKLQILSKFSYGKIATIVWTTCHPVRTLIYPLFHPSGRCAIPSRRPDRPSIIRQNYVAFHPDSPLYREASVPSCIRQDVSVSRPDASQYSTKLQILSKFSYGKIATTVRTTWIPVRTCFSLSQELQFKFNRQDASLPSSERAYI